MLFLISEEISVGVTMTLNQTYQTEYNNVLSSEYQQFVDSYTQAVRFMVFFVCLSVVDVVLLNFKCFQLEMYFQPIYTLWPVFSKAD